MNTADIENQVREYLVSKNIYPFSVLYSGEYDFLKISFYLPGDISDFLSVSGYFEVCDNSGTQTYQETKTVLLTGISLKSFLSHV